MAVSSNKKRKTETNTSFPDDFKAIQFLKSKIPSNLKCLNFSEVNRSDEFISSYVIGKVIQSWPISERIKNGYLLKIMISEVNSNYTNFEEAKLAVFLFDKFALEANPITINSFIAFCGFTTEHLTAKGDTNILPYQVLVKPAENTKIWILKRKAHLKMNNHPPHQSHPVNASKSRTYVYNTLREAIEEYNINPNKQYNVYGVVMHCEIVSNSRFQNSYIELAIMDKSTNNFNCLIFGNQDENFPNIEPGDVIRLHRMKIDKFRKTHKGKCFMLKDIVVFKDNDNVESNASTYTYTEDDKMKVKEFQNWKKSVNIKYKTFSDITSGEYADILCQIVSVNVVNDDLVILKVWDGSEPQCPLKSYQGVFKETKSYEKLLHLSKYIVDIWIYDSHAKEAAKLEPIQIVEIRNVHMYIPKNSLASKNQICLHSSTNLERAILVLTDNDFLVKNFKEKLCNILASCLSYEINNAQETEMKTSQKNSGFVFESMDDSIVISDCTDSQLKEINQLEELARINFEIFQSVESNLKINSNDDSFLNEITDSHLKESEEGTSNINGNMISNESFDGNFQWEEVKTVTANRFHKIAPVSINKLLRGNVPGKYRVFANVLEITPSVENVRNFLFVHCPTCHFLRPELSMNISCIQNGHPVYYCSKCSKTSVFDKPGISTPCFALQYTYLLDLVLQDGTGKINVYLYQKNAIEFFKGILPQTLLNPDSKEAEKVLQYLKNICPNSFPAKFQACITSRYPVIDCCIQSYHGESDIYYQIFGTICR